MSNAGEGSGSAGIGLVDETAFADSLIASSALQAPPEFSGPSAPAAADAAAPEERPWVGRHLGHFKLLSLLGEGAMGLVIRGLDMHLGRMVALKVLRKRVRGMDESQRVAQFLREARAASRIEHPCVAAVYTINEHSGWWYIATELIEGGSLHGLVNAAGPLPAARACALAADAASALAAAHRMGIIHRDIKPQNLMVTRSGRCKLVDFGLVRLDDPDDPFDFTNRVVGTPLYVAPEVAQRKPATGASDVYSLGCTLFYALCGEPPFKGQSAKDVWRLHVEAPRPDVRQRCLGCPDRVADLVARAMSVDPAERPTAEQFEAQLRIETIGELSGGGTGSSAIGPDASASWPALPGLRPSEVGTTTPSSAPSASGRFGAVLRRNPVASAAAALAVVAVAIAALALLQPTTRAWFGGLFGSGATPEAPATGHGPGLADAATTAAPLASREAFAARFSNAPQSYGGPATAPAAMDAWSWRGRVDPGASRFVAHRGGRVAFPVDHPDAMMIPASDAVFFSDTEAVQAAGLRLLEPRR